MFEVSFFEPATWEEVEVVLAEAMRPAATRLPHGARLARQQGRVRGAVDSQ
jgi:hypothetical protein